MKNASENKNRTVLITGTTSGIGYELSKLFAINGFKLVLVSRDEKKLKAQKENFANKYGVEIYTIAKDLSDPKSPEEVFSEVQGKGIHVDILVNNAGFNESGSFDKTSLEKELQMLRLHIVSLTHMTKLFLKGMVQKRYGKILNLGSTGSFAPCPLDAVYCATKAYVLSFSSAIRIELEGTGVMVSTLCPGATRTEFAKKANIEDTKLFSRFVMEPQRVAEIAYSGLMKNKKVIIAGTYNKLMVASMTFTPNKILEKVSLSLLSKG
jgi:short-subunit dehydrogenase